MIKLLIGGSPCTYWSIAQKNNRETKAEGLGWELFKNYLVAKEKFKPDLFLYENNKSAAKAIKDQIKQELGVWDGSILTEDSGTRYIEINSALVSAQNRQRFYVHNCGEVEQPKDRGITLCDVLESGERIPHKQQIDYIADTVCIDALPRPNDSKTGLYAIPTNNPECFLSEKMIGYAYKVGTKGYHASIRVLGDKARAITTQQNKRAGITNYIPQNIENINCTITTDGKAKNAKPIYAVKNGIISINGNEYPIKLADGYYVIRKLSVKECERLQTMPEDYCKSVSNVQAYKGLGNGWTAEVIIHILNYALKDVPKDEEIVVLSMYDGIGTGRYCLDKMGFKNVRYYAYEIDKYAITVAKDNYPDIIECGDAFQVRNEDWRLYD